MESKSVRHLGVIGKHDHWETPRNLFIERCVDFHIQPELDVCATKDTTKCDHYFGPDHKMKKNRDALKINWTMDFFMNCPYTEVDEFMDYAFDQIWKHRVNALILTYSKTDTKWWHRHIENNPLVKVHFQKGRIKFLENGEVSANSAPYPSVWLVVKIPKYSK